MKQNVLNEVKKLEMASVKNDLTPRAESFTLMMTQFMFKLDSLEDKFNVAITGLEDALYQ